MPYPGTADLCPGGPLTSPQLVGTSMNSYDNRTPKQETEADTPKTSKPMAAAGPVSFGSNCASTSKGAIPKQDMWERRRPTDWDAGEECAPAPPSAAATSKPKYTYAERRVAAQTLRSFARSTRPSQSAEWLKKVEWARQVIPDYGLPHPPKTKEKAKRQSSTEASGPGAKKAKTKPSVSFADLSRNRILIGVVDRGHPEGHIPKNMWKRVEGELLLKCIELLGAEPGPPPACEDAGWYQGKVKVVACDDTRSVDLYKMAIGLLGEVYKGANLEAVDWSEIPSRPRARIWFPSTLKDPKKILFLLQRCNPNISTHDWKVVKVEEHEGHTNQAVVILNRESLAQIEAAKGKLSFGLMTIHMKVYRGDSNSSTMPGGNPAELDIADELEAPEDGYCIDTPIKQEAMENMNEDYSDYDEANGVEADQSPPY